MGLFSKRLHNYMKAKCAEKNRKLIKSIVYLCLTHLQVESVIQNVYFGSANSYPCVISMEKKVKLAFMKMLNGYGYSEKAIDELWKWYDT